MATRRVAHPRIVFVIAALAAMTGCMYGPPYDQLLTGDEELLEYAKEKFTDAGDRVAMAVIDGDDVRTAFVSADSSTMFELGSATRLLTGLLLADAIERGEVALDDPIGWYLPLGDSPAASLTLRSLATQHSGLPPGGPRWVDPEVLADGASDSNDAPPEVPAPVDLEEVLDLVSAVPVDPSVYDYSHLQATLVGHVLAEAADRDFAELLEERVLEPVGMENAVLAESVEDVPDALVRSEGAYVPQTGAYAPAMGLIVTIDDMIALARDVISGDASDSAALEPLVNTPHGKRIGYFWEVASRPEGDIIALYGWSRQFCAAMVVSAEDRHAAIVLRNSGDTYPWDEGLEVFAIVED
ncbi:CubicO group peptidase (beta-lactamase class C family) [Agromyces flavus]|uniref:CubicO group peptidase (Beta-lactamase class C family) n=1 Tax=Agromyces flavus TaxID=589382 RepID=A0A1H1YH64_9MICO|nr:serine hydrolase domain-containing protein [Agromyces flavus]MCP2366694.1 CubicO group peptidase (beta-lactamase class C family) [Agromyces flavus]GGI45188.1 hypothetical protein GCM10010932_08370 [Agromyces flavus]SDT20868.1 CubicO group peptidase, beta-lactamase class C family [Agromyces flavus]